MMQKTSYIIGLLAILSPLFAGAQAPLTSPHPKLRPVISSGLAPSVVKRPKLRPVGSPRSQTLAAVEKVVVEDSIADDQAHQVAARVAVSTSGGTIVTASPYAVARSLRPKARPKRLNTKPRRLAVVKPKKPVKYGKKGSVCGVRGIRGYKVSRVQGKIPGCSIPAPVKLTEIDGVKLTREVLVGCNTAKALYSWVQKSAKPAVGNRGGGLAKIQTIAGYSCRNRNSAKKGRLSEHAKGNAVDIAGFVLKNGSTVSVLKDWRNGNGPMMKRLHKTACGPFKTVLGPNANRFHQDHFHFDVAQHRGGGTYCR